MFSKLRFCLDNLSNEDRNLIKRIVDQEDGLCQDYLDDDVSYLIITRVGSKNYYIAQEQNIPIIPPQWIIDSVNKKELQNPNNYSFKLFEGIIATTTGFDLHERYTMQSEIELHGGIFERELVYDHTTYLIARNTQSEKYRTAVEWPNVIIVNEDWLNDSCHRGKLQNPIHYQNFSSSQISTKQDKATHLPQQSKTSQITSFTDSCLSMIQPLDDSYLTPNKTVARTREVDLLLDGFIVYLSIENPKSYKRIQSILLSHGCFCIDSVLPSTTLIVAETLSDYQNVIKTLHEQQGLASPSSTSSYSGFDTTATTTTTNQEFDAFSIPIVNINWVLDTHSMYAIQSFEEFQWTRGIFSNLTFFIYDFKRDYEKVKQSIEANDGKVIQSITDATFIVCPRTVDSTIYQDDRAVSAKWLKACLDAKKLVSRSSMILYRPFPRLLKDRILCLTGFGSDDRLKMESYIVALGGKLENTVTSNLYALICQEHVKLNVKIREAKKLNIPLIRRDWIDHLIIHKELVSFEDYYFTEDEKKEEEIIPNENTEVLEKENLISEVIQKEETDSTLPSLKAASTSSLYMIDCRSNSVASEGKQVEEIPTSLFGEKKDQEVIYTSFNEIFKNSTPSCTSDSQKSLLLEKQIQLESQNILSPLHQKSLASIDNSLLHGLSIPNGGKTWGSSIMSKNVNRISLEENENEKEEKTRKETSVTVLEDDTPEEKKGKKRRGRPPKEKNQNVNSTKRRKVTKKS